MRDERGKMKDESGKMKDESGKRDGVGRVDRQKEKKRSEDLFYLKTIGLESKRTA